jgi:hypothetical protein
MNATQIESAIKTQWVSHWIRQCRVGCGYGEDGERTVDLWGISVKRPYLHVAVEIKVSRADFLRDVKQPLKQRRARLMANQFYFAAPSGVLTTADMPTWAGLVEVNDESNVTIVVPAPWFDSSPPTWSFVASLVRRFEKAVYSPSVNVLDVCAELVDAVSRGDASRQQRAIHKARIAISEARKQRELL